MSWNTEMIVTLAEAADVLDRPDYHQAAEAAVVFLLETLRTGTDFHRIYFEGRADTPAQLADIAGLGRALLALHDHAVGPEWLTQAVQVAGMLTDGFLDEGRAMRMTEVVAGLGPVRPIDDTELASGNAMALEFLAGLDRRMARAGAVAPGLAAATALDAIRQPRQRAGVLTAIEVSRYGLSGPMRVSSGGAVRVLARADRAAGELAFDIRVGEGWHINAHTPLEDYLIGMALDVDGTAVPETAFPAASVLTLGFSDAPLAVYETGFVLSAPVRFSSDVPATAKLTLQACNDEICLPPDDMVFYLWSR